MRGTVDATPLRLPFQGATPLAAHCSAEGARHAAHTATGQAARLLELYRTHGPLTDAEASDLLGIQRCAVNARRWWLIAHHEIDPQPKGSKKNPLTGVRNTTWGI